MMIITISIIAIALYLIGLIYFVSFLPAFKKKEEESKDLLVEASEYLDRFGKKE